MTTPYRDALEEELQILKRQNKDLRNEIQSLKEKAKEKKEKPSLFTYVVGACILLTVLWTTAAVVPENTIYARIFVALGGCATISSIIIFIVGCAAEKFREQ